MTSQSVVRPGAGAAQSYDAGLSGPAPANLGDILERVLDKGIVIAGDIRVNLLDIELLTVKLRLIVASVQTARELGVNWWESDPWLTAGGGDGDVRELRKENRRLQKRIAELEEGLDEEDGQDEDER